MRASKFAFGFYLFQTLFLQIHAFSPLPFTTKDVSFHSKATCQYATKTKYDKKWNVSSAGLDKGDRNNEVKRIKFMMNQLRGSLQESEMRATAAERRVAALQKSLNEMEEQDNPNLERKSDSKSLEEAKLEFQAVKEENMKLRDKINQLVASMDFSKTNAKKKIALMEKERDRIKRDLEGEINEAKKSLEDAREEIKRLKVDLDNTKERLTLELEEFKLTAENEMKETVTKFNIDIEDLKSEFMDEKNVLLDEKASIETTLGASEKKVEKLLGDLETTKRDMTDQLVCAKLKHEKELAKVTQDLKKSTIVVEAKQNKIIRLETERKSLRKLTRLQLSIVKQRIVGKFKRRQSK